MLHVRDARGALRGCSATLTLAPGAPHALRAACFLGCLVVGRPFGPLVVTAVDAFGNLLSAGDRPSPSPTPTPSTNPDPEP